MLSGQYAARSRAEAGKMYSDYLAEVTPSGQTVWQWRTWEHLDPVADGIVEVQAPRTLWAQGNSVQELPDGDILASYRPTSTVIRISRKTGKILWKLGTPTVAGQHAPTLLENGNILIFDNGPHRLDEFCTVFEGNRGRSGHKRDRVEVSGQAGWNFFSPRMGCAQRLPNGNTLITESSFGRLFEVTKEGEIVWEYVNPFFGKPFFGGPPTSESNQVFRALRYSAAEVARARGAGPREEQATWNQHHAPTTSSVTAQPRSAHHMGRQRPLSISPRQFAAPASVMVRPLLLKPQWMNGLSERLLVSHYENNYGGALRRLNAIERVLRPSTGRARRCSRPMASSAKS